MRDLFEGRKFKSSSFSNRPNPQHRDPALPSPLNQSYCCTYGFLCRRSNKFLATGRAELILHIDYYNRGFGRIQSDDSGLRTSISTVNFISPLWPPRGSRTKQHFAFWSPQEE